MTQFVGADITATYDATQLAIQGPAGVGDHYVAQGGKIYKFVKFNNGVYHNGKTSSLTSSWNASVLMNTVFDLVGIPM